MNRVGLSDRWVFRPPGIQDHCLGATDYAGLKRLYTEADAVLNLSGAQELRADHSTIRCLIYVETDPVANQIKVASGDMRTIQALGAHDHIFTYGENLGAPDCQLPLERFVWQPTRPPVCLDWWANDYVPAEDAPLTTVANWRHSGKDVSWQGETYYWSKHREFLRFANLPSRSVLPLELALGAISKNEATQMCSRGWRIVPSANLAEPGVYRDYIRDSRGEFTVAKDQYVRPRSGWFSERSVCYLAAGRPVITQDTGFGNSLPTGEGLFSFSTEDEALAAIEAIAHDYPHHSAVALEIAHEYFDAERILGDMLRRVGLF